MQWAAFFSFILASCYTPGPNILLAMNTARISGFKQTLPLMWGMGLGIFIIMLANAFANIFIAGLMPRLLPFLRTAGAASLLWLAWKIAFPSSASPNETENGQKVPRALDGFTLQFLNPKVILFGFTSMSSFITPWTTAKTAYFLCALFTTANCVAAFVLWAAAGSLQRRFLHKQGRAAGIIMGLLLAWCAFSVSGLGDLL